MKHGECSIEVYCSRTDGTAIPDILYNLPLAARNAVAIGIMAAESIRGGSYLKEVKPN